LLLRADARLRSYEPDRTGKPVFANDDVCDEDFGRRRVRTQRLNAERGNGCR